VDFIQTKNNAMKHGNSVIEVFGVLLGFFWHASCFAMDQEAVNGVVGLADCINSAGV